MLTDTSLPTRASSVARSLAIGGWLVVAVAVWGSLIVWVMRGLPALPLSFGHGPGSVALALLAFTYGTVGAMLAVRRPRNAIGWLFLFTGIILSLVSPLTLIVDDAIHTFRPIPGVTLVLTWVISSFVAPFAAGMAFIVALIFPGSRAPGAWQVLVGMLLLAGLLITAMSALNPSGIIWYPTLPNPLQIPEGMTWTIQAVRITAVTLSVVSMLAVAASLPIRYQRADPVLRVQLRWVMAAIAILPPTVAPLFVARYISGADQMRGEAFVVLASLGGCAFPFAVAMAITRYHLFGIERLVERALVYVPLMAILGGLYAASLALFQRLFVAVTGFSSDAAIVLATLILASTFTPIRQALERAVDRRFNIRSHPAAQHGAVGAGPAAAGTEPVHAGPPADAALALIADRLAAIESRLGQLEAMADDPREPGEAAGHGSRSAPQGGARSLGPRRVRRPGAAEPRRRRLLGP